MAKWDLVSCAEWKSNFLAEIEAQPHTTAKGDAFVGKVLQIYYNLSESDAIDATDCAGANDHGVDALFIFPEEEDNDRFALAVQGKYGTASKGLQVYTEAEKFFTALTSAREGLHITYAIDKLAGVLRGGGLVQYIILTVDLLNSAQQKSLENIKKIAYADFGEKLVVEAINLGDVYAALGTKNDDVIVDLPCQVVQVTDAVVGLAKLTDMYDMMRNYAKQTGGAVDRIYDYNLRKYIKRRRGSVNDGIYDTLENYPHRFLAYNNGITMICNAARQFESGLRLKNPYIVNGCQTTRTLYDFMERRFSGSHTLTDFDARQFQEAFMAVKVLVVKDMDGDDSYAKNITRYSNKQNAIGKRDFIALEAKYKELKTHIGKMGYFLEIQKGEYDALPKSKRTKYPSPTHLINSFEATLFYAAGILGKPHLAFGRSGYFAPGGIEYDKIVEDLTPDDLFVPWMIAKQGERLGYAAKAQRDASHETAHHVQTRYLFLYIFFRLVRQMVAKILLEKNDNQLKENIYRILMVLKADYNQHPKPEHPFAQLLTITDEVVFTLISLAEEEEGYKDRASFLESKELIEGTRINPIISPAKLKVYRLANQIQQIMSNQQHIVA